MSELDWYITTWVRWHRTAMRWHYGRCASIEGNWRANAYWDAPPITPLGRIDNLAAQKVEDAWRTLPSTEKLLLKWHYVFARSPWAICRSFRQRGTRLSTSRYPQALELAEKMLAEALAIEKKTVDNPLVAVVCEPRPLSEDEASPQEREAA